MVMSIHSSIHAFIHSRRHPSIHPAIRAIHLRVTKGDMMAVRGSFEGRVRSTGDSGVVQEE